MISDEKGREVFDELVAGLRAENAALRTLLVDLLRTVKEVELNLQAALDKDRDED